MSGRCLGDSPCDVGILLREVVSEARSANELSEAGRILGDSAFQPGIEPVSCKVQYRMLMLVFEPTDCQGTAGVCTGYKYLHKDRAT